MVLNSHYLGILLFVPIGIYLWFSKKNILFKQYFVSSLLLLILMLSPLLIFDFRHGWQNFQSFKKFVTIRQETVNIKPYKAIPNLWPLYTQINSSLILAKQNIYSPYLSILILISLIYYLRKSKLLIIWIITGLFGLGLYKQHIYDHYFGFLFPAIFLSLGLAFKLIGKKLSWLLFLFLLFININHHPLLSEPNNQMWRTRQISEFITRQSQNQPFNLALLSDHNYDASYRYYLKNDYYTLHDKITDQLFVICENSKCDVINNPLWEIAGFGWAKIDFTWDFPWGVKLFRLVHNPTGKS